MPTLGTVTSRRGFLKGLLAAAFIGPALLARREQEPVVASPTTTPTIDFYQSDYGMVTVHHDAWKGKPCIVIDEYSRQMKRAMEDINRVVNENLWNGGKLRA